MDALKDLIPLLIGGSLALLVIGVGLDATISDLLSVLRRPVLLARSILALQVIPTAAAVALVLMLSLTPAVEAAIVAMAVSPLPVLALGKEFKGGGEKSYVYGLYLAIALLAIVLVPGTLALLSALLPADAALAPMQIARSVATTVLIPMALGLAIRQFAPRLAEGAAPWVRRLAGLMLVLGFLPVIAGAWPALIRLIGEGAVLVMAAVVAAALAGGHLLGGPAPEGRVALAVASAVRHPGLALLTLKVNAADLHAGAGVLLFVLVGVAVSGLYLAWLKRRSAAPALQS